MASKDLVELELSVPLTNVGKFEGGTHNRQRNVTVFHGKVLVDADMAEDLRRREKEYLQYQAGLVSDNGSTGQHIEDIQ